MRKQININGISTSSSYGDGDCLSMVNLRKKNGVLKPVTPRKVINTLNYAYDYLFVHQLPNTNENWIGIRSGKLYWIENITTTKTEHEYCSISGFKSISQIGNVLNVLDSTGLQYLIWSENEYKLINANFDGGQTDTTLLPVKVDLRNSAVNDYAIAYEESTERTYSTPQSAEDDMINVATSIDGLISKALSVEEAEGYNYGFYQACTAIELYDGNYILHSSPVLIGQSLDKETRYNLPIGDYRDNPTVSYIGVPVDGGSQYGAYSRLRGVQTKDENNSYKLSGYTGYGSVSPYNGNYFNFKQYSSPFISTTYPVPKDTSDAYWTVVADDSSVSYYEPVCFDMPSGTKVRMFVATEFGGSTWCAIRTALRYEQSAFPNLIGYMDKWTANSRPVYANVIVRRSTLQFNVMNNIDEKYRPLIKSVSVFCTKQILGIKQIQNQWQSKRISSVQISTNYKIDNYLPDIKTNAEIIKELEANQQFYKVHEIPFDDIKTTTDNGGWVTIDLKGKLGDNLIMQEELPADNFTHHTLLPQKQMVYNSKLHAMDYKTILSRGFPYEYFEQIETGVGQFPTTVAPPTTGGYPHWWVEVKIKTENGISTVVRHKGQQYGTWERNTYAYAPMLSYPDSRAIEMTFYIGRFALDGTAGYNKTTFKLTASPNQNFAYYISPDLKPITYNYTGTPSVVNPTETSRELIYRNSMKVSAVNNPFYFPNKSVFTVGTGVILNAGTNAIRMSEGQFGQYDLYVFTDEGVYSLDTGTAITYNRISPSSTELPISNIICSTPFGVIFIGKRGLFIINGQQVELITSQLEQEPLTFALNMPTVQNVPNIASIKTWNDWFKDYLSNVTEIVYDNQNNEIIIMNPGKDYNFVYNIDSKEFYQQTEKIDKIVGGVFPELYAMDGATIKDFGQNKTTTVGQVTTVDKAKVSFITRPFNFGTTDIKKLERTILRARLHQSSDIIAMNHCSNDGINFVPVQGKTFAVGNYRDIDLGLMARNKHKQFMYAFAAELDEDSQINLIDAEVSQEYTNEKMR